MNNISLRLKIILSMISLVLVSLVLMATITVYHFKNENQRYHTQRLARKEKKLLTHINLILKENNSIKTDSGRVKFVERKINELQVVHNLKIHLFDINGKFISSSEDSIFHLPSLSKDILKKLDSQNLFIEELESYSLLKQANLRSYSYIKFNGKKLLILYLPYVEENAIFRNEIENLLFSYAQMYIFILIGAIIFAFFVSRYITLSLKKISVKLNKTELNSNKPLIWNSNDEIGQLVIAYNQMVKKLEESTKKSLKNERENAWREMAKQVAHEIKNPLTPMRLQVQLLERNALKLTDENEKEQLLDFSKGMLLQIDTLTRIASEFSNFAKMPIQQLKEVDFCDFAKRFSNLHSHSTIKFDIENTEMLTLIDEKQFSRVLNNIIKNAEQSIPFGVTANISITVSKQENFVRILISDNGIGIKESERFKIFEPKFTTKNGGMGLGLGIAKNIIESLRGEIWFESQQNKGTTFYILIPIIKI